LFSHTHTVRIGVVTMLLVTNAFGVSANQKAGSTIP